MGLRRFFRPAIVLAPLFVAGACAADPGDDPKTDASSALSDEAGSGSGVGASGSTSTSGSGSSGAVTPPPAEDASVAEAASDDATDESTEASVTPPPPSCPMCQLKVAYFTSDAATASSATQVNFVLNILNAGGTTPQAAMPQALSELTVRYWFTADGAPTVTAISYYATIGSTNVMTSVESLSSATVPPATATADSYVEIAFGAGAGSIAPMSDTGQIQIAFVDSDHSGPATHFNENNDYSFNAKDTSANCNAADMNNAPSCLTDFITLYRGGKLVWGTEPGMTTTDAGDP